MLIFPLFIIVMDPFHHYHAPWFDMPVMLDDVVYQTPGNAVNLEYNSAIVGTSMTENCRVSWFNEELGWDTMKLCYAGATCNDLNAILQCVYANDRLVEHIFMDLNDYQLSSPVDASYVERPEYLYTKTILDDYRYFYNKDVFVKATQLLVSAARGEESNMEMAYTWEDETLFGREKVLEGTLSTKEKLLEEETEKKMVSEEERNRLKKEELENALNTCQENLNQILPFIKEHPETEYIIFFPPYSMLYWEQLVIQDELEEKLKMYQYAIEQLLPYENVKIYYFQGEEVIEDLDEYRDYTHYKPKYNRYIFECVKEDKNRLTQENYENEIQKMYEKTKSYDYEALWK